MTALAWRHRTGGVHLQAIWLSCDRMHKHPAAHGNQLHATSAHALWSNKLKHSKSREVCDAYAKRKRPLTHGVRLRAVWTEGLPWLEGYSLATQMSMPKCRALKVWTSFPTWIGHSQPSHRCGAQEQQQDRTSQCLQCFARFCTWRLLSEQPEQPTFLDTSRDFPDLTTHPSDSQRQVRLGHTRRRSASQERPSCRVTQSRSNGNSLYTPAILLGH